MSLTLTDIITEAGRRLWDPLGKRFTQADIISWLNFTIDDVAYQCKFQKKQASLVGSGYVSAAGTSPRYFALPSDFLSLTRERGILVNGSLRAPSSTADVEGAMQENPYFYQDFSGMVFNYALDREMRYLSVASPATYTTGPVLWFYPDVADADTITYWYHALPEQFAADDLTQTPELARNVQEVLIHGIIYRAMQKMYWGGACDENKLNRADGMYEVAKRAVEDFYLDEKRAQRRPTIKTAHHLGMYNTARRVQRPTWHED